MLDIQDNSIAITLDDGTVETWKILFYYHNDEREKDYYFIYKDEDEDSIIVMASKDGETLEECSEEELEEAEEVLEAYESDPKIGDIK
ncbi:MAG: hypothetical protein MJ238_03360 [Bacilli bacterium]|nr:hypothetical protein [Bacilli bacterium]